MKFKKYLNEIFDSNIDIETDISGNNFTYYFKTSSGKEFTVVLEKIYKFKPDLWHFLFMDEKFKSNLTGDVKKEVFEVFSGVIKSMVLFFNKKTPEYFYFTAKELKRIKLYDKFILGIKNKFKYKFIEEDNYPKEIIKLFKDINEKDKIYLFKK